MSKKARLEKPNAQYNVASPDSLTIRITGMMRRRIYNSFMEKGKLSSLETILDVGVTSDRSYHSSNYLEAWYPYKENITAVGIDDASFLEQEYPGMKFIYADGKALPFRDSAFDIVHSSAVIEHVGNTDEQARYVGELYRVSRRFVCLTTPNRWFPIEVHTTLPLIHWLPAVYFRKLLKLIGLPFFADEDNLNLLGRSDLIALCNKIGIDNYYIEGVRLGGWHSNLMLFIWK